MRLTLLYLLESKVERAPYVQALVKISLALSKDQLGLEKRVSCLTCL